MVAKMETESPTKARARDSTSNKLAPTVAISTIELIEVPIEKVASPRTATKLAAVQSDADLVISDELFPVEINLADYEVLLRVPGIGVRSAQRIVRARRQGHLGIDDLAKLGVVLKRARYFLTARGRYPGGCAMESSLLRRKLVGGQSQQGGIQLELPLSQPQATDERISLIAGEL